MKEKLPNLSRDNDNLPTFSGGREAISPLGKTVEQALLHIFPDNSESKRLSGAREILGIGEETADQELETLLSQVECLIEAVLDTYEKGLFQGKTLSEVVKENIL